MKKSTVFCLAVILIICGTVYAQWQPIEGTYYKGDGGPGDCLFYDEMTDEIGLYDANYYHAQITLLWNISKQEWEVIDRIKWDRSLQIERFGYSFEETTGNVIYSKKLDKWINICAIWSDGDFGPDFFEVMELTKDGWQPLNLNHTIDSEYDYFIAADDEGKILLLNESMHKRESWILDGTEWNRIKIPRPSRRAESSMTYDNKRREFIMFGGVKARKHGDVKYTLEFTFLNDTWALAGNKWRMTKPRKSPKTRSESYMFYHPKYEQVVLYGGNIWKNKKNADGTTFIYFSDIWRWTGTNWKRIVKNTEVDGEAIHGPITYDSRRDRMIAFYKNQLWEYRFSNKN